MTALFWRLWDVMRNEEVCEVARKRILMWHKKNGTVSSVNRGHDEQAILDIVCQNIDTAES
uniref:Uncharacterized protein n=1 Tax=Utricularia reniformis TaxID=192314 RepID=A0A1Y0B3H5_9LAMI|nr:hypothetical protein AEK19_MT1834 [Utricularia reniformis]ART32005.1 hypothetical protein AEK19_MT1834 [Utricularia reniformis]